MQITIDKYSGFCFGVVYAIQMAEEILKKENRAKLKGINIIKKHEKTTKEKKGGIISKENFIDISNLKNLDSENDKNVKKDKIDKK